MKLSIFLAGMRKTNWLNLYQSIAGSTTIKDYELVIVSPYRDDEIPKFVHTTENIKHIYDKGNCTRCYQLALINCSGKYVVSTADDGTFDANLGIDQAFDVRPKHRKGVTSLTYIEGRDIPKKRNRRYWIMGSHKLLNEIPFIRNYYVIALTLMRRDYLMEIGGWDCRFEYPGLGSPDLAIRLQNDGAEVALSKSLMQVGHCKRGKDQWGVDHDPIIAAHYENDVPLFKRLYSSPSGRTRTRIDFNNWKQAPAVWTRRFE